MERKKTTKRTGRMTVLPTRTKKSIIILFSQVYLMRHMKWLWVRKPFCFCQILCYFLFFFFLPFAISYMANLSHRSLSLLFFLIFLLCFGIIFPSPPPSDRTAAYISYPITFLLREARKGTLNQSERFHHSMFNNIHGGNVATYLSPRDFIELVQANHEYISQHVQNKLNDEYGWFRVFLNFQQMAGITEPDSISLLEFDDRNDSHRLAYGIGVNRYVQRTVCKIR